MPTTYPEPEGPPTPRKDARFVVLGGPQAGIHKLNNWLAYIPNVGYGGPCFPIHIHCRSEEEAERAWLLQPIAEVVERKSEQQVAFAFMMNVVACALFDGDENTDFYGGFFGIPRRRVVFFSWDEAYPFVRHYTRPRTFVQRAKSFVDALVYLCLGPCCGAGGFQNPVEYVRPKLIKRIDPVKRTRLPISQPSEPATSASSAAPAVVVVSDDSEDEEAFSIPPEPSPPPSDPSERIVTVPTWIIEALNNGIDMNDPPVVHVRDIGGNLVRTYTTCPRGVDSVPCLGALADTIVDLLGYMPSTICCLRSVYLTARQSSGAQRTEFIEAMAEYGMPLFEAAIFWRIIGISPGQPLATRERFKLLEE